MFRWYQILQPYIPSHPGVVGMIQVLCGVHYYVKVAMPQAHFPQRGLTKDKLDMHSHDSVGQQRQSPTWGYGSSQAAVSAEVFWTAPASLAGLFPCKERGHSGWACKRFLISVDAIYTPCCFEPVTVEVKRHQRFWKLSQVTLEGSYQRQAIKMTI